MVLRLELHGQWHVRRGRKVGFFGSDGDNRDGDGHTDGHKHTWQWGGRTEVHTTPHHVVACHMSCHDMP